MPHEEILEQVREPLRQAGITLQIVTFNDYVQPNLRLIDGDLDANFYQTQSYADVFRRDRGVDLVSIASVHLEPFGLYSRKHVSLNDLPQRATVALPNEPSNQVRALKLLAKHGLITLIPVAKGLSGIAHIGENPRQLQFRELEGPMLPRALDGVDIAGINANFALTAGLTPARDALACEDDADQDYANVLVVRGDDTRRPHLQALAEALHTQPVRAFIEEHYKGAVLPVF